MNPYWKCYLAFRTNRTSSALSVNQTSCKERPKNIETRYRKERDVVRIRIVEEVVAYLWRVQTSLRADRIRPLFAPERRSLAGVMPLQVQTSVFVKPQSRDAEYASGAGANVQRMSRARISVQQGPVQDNSNPQTSPRRCPDRRVRRLRSYSLEESGGDTSEARNRILLPSTHDYPRNGLSNNECFSSDEDTVYTPKTSDVEENARTARSMGVIRKNTASRGGDGGTKYYCDVCSVDITSTVRITCANSACREYDLCVPCFGRGEKSKTHDPQAHEFHVVEQNSIPIYTDDWGADDELLLLEGSERYGLGSWNDVAEHIGGYREKDEVRDHYTEIYLNSSLFPLPELADPKNTQLFERVPKEDFQARKKRRIEERTEAAKTAPPATPKQKPTASVPACHEVQGFMPGRLEFETEFANDAEEAVQHMSFEPGDGLDPETGQMDEETTLKMTVFDIYNSRLKARTERKRIIFEHNLLEYKKNQLIDKKRTKEEKDLLQKAKPFARMMNHEDCEALNRDLLNEHNLRIAIAQLQEWKQMGITDLRQGEKYENDKAARAQRNQPQGQFDRMPQIPKKGALQQQPDGPTEASKLTTPELPLRLQRNTKSVRNFVDAKQPVVENEFDKMFAETHGAETPTQKPKVRYVPPPLTGITPWKLEDEKSVADLHLLSEEEIQLCNVLHIKPKPYLALKEGLLKEAMKQGGHMKKKEARGVCRIDVNKANRIFDFMIHSGWIAKA